MKKRSRKLTLHRETVRNLGGGDLRRIVGGTGGDTTEACEEASHCACPSEGGTECYPPSACFGTCSCG